MLPAFVLALWRQFASANIIPQVKVHDSKLAEREYIVIVTSIDPKLYPHPEGIFLTFA